MESFLRPFRVKLLSNNVNKKKKARANIWCQKSCDTRIAGDRRPI